MKNNCAEYERFLIPYLVGDLEGDLLLRVEGHLRACPRCRECVQGQKRIEELLLRVPTPGMPAGLAERIHATLPDAPNALNPVLARRLRVLRSLDIGSLLVAAVSLVSLLIPAFSGWALGAMESLGIGRGLMQFLEGIAVQAEVHHAVFLFCFVAGTLTYLMEHFLLQRVLVQASNHTAPR